MIHNKTIGARFWSINVVEMDLDQVFFKKFDTGEVLFSIKIKMLPTIDTEPDCQFREMSLIFQVQISIILNVQNVRQKFPKSLAGSKLAKKRPSLEPKFRLFAIVQGPNQLCKRYGHS